MNSLEIDEILRGAHSTRRWYRGCYSSDQLSESIVQRGAKLNIVIANTVPASSMVMGHWIAIIVKPELLIFFDSFGRSPFQFSQNITNFVNCYAPPLLWNKLAIQASNSCICGLYVIFMSVQVASGRHLSDIMSLFSRTNYHLNDRLVYAWCLRNVGASRRLSRRLLFDCAL